MKETENRGRVPRLRFPEFRESGEWETIPLSQLAKRSTQKNNRGELNSVLTNSAEFGVVDQRDYFDKDIATQGNLEGYFVIEKGDYVYNPRISKMAPVGPISKNNIATGVMSPLYTVFRFNNSHNDFFAYYFKTTGWHQYMRQTSSTGARHDRVAVTNGDFMAMPLPVTLLEEQQKIADCLSSLDNLITLEAQKLGALKTHKKGLMQQLFPAEGETVPRLRFPEFRDAWQIRKLEEIADFFKGKGISKADIDPQGQTPCIRYGELYTEYNESIKNVFSRTNVSPSELFLSRANDVIVPASGETKIDIARASCVKLDQVALGGDLNVLRPNIDGLFLSYILNGPAKEEIARTAQGDTVVHLYASQLKLIDLPVPGHEEQQKISDCLSSLDDLITAQAQKVGALKTHKKGLMQQLFPVLDDTPG
ncbi:restriction endonuclease subunit S [Acidithiobacillus ferriphilus]|uniref:restriction endonuclease subunit S n=1 Tax=Acidithiobacillus ferriphilus TaxID=1689834 RepID=UPI001C06A3C8|nr:restriction endonuclease subunit S [Acidithiobacillus ferriphilus]MBU2832114.1 restriction endonuclease subunit S [Acidithiobacillus ferriphilus]